MKSLILHPTDTCQWYSLILEAQAQANICLSESSESYLVFLMMRSSHNTIWLDSVVGMDFMHALQLKGKQQKQMLVEIGDRSLLLSGFFPELVVKRQLTPQYYIQLGQLAYANASPYPHDKEFPLYQELSEKFINLQQILDKARTLFQS